MNQTIESLLVFRERRPSRPSSDAPFNRLPRHVGTSDRQLSRRKAAYSRRAYH
jgi:hypothetical protein